MQHLLLTGALLHHALVMEMTLDGARNLRLEEEGHGGQGKNLRDVAMFSGQYLIFQIFNTS